MQGPSHERAKLQFMKNSHRLSIRIYWLASLQQETFQSMLLQRKRCHLLSGTISKVELLVSRVMITTRHTSAILTELVATTKTLKVEKKSLRLSQQVTKMTVAWFSTMSMKTMRCSRRHTWCSNLPTTLGMTVSPGHTTLDKRRSSIRS